MIDIKWNRNSLLNLVMRRLANNSEFLTYYSLEEDRLLNDFESQEDLLARIFPEEIDTGRNPKTFEWILARTKDASGDSAPREIIHLLQAARDAQVARIGRG